MVIENIQRSLVLFIALFCAARSWNYDIGFNLFIFDIAAILFIGISFVKLVFGNFKVNLHDKRLRIFVALLLFIFFVKLISVIGLYTTGYSAESFSQYIVYMISELVHIIFFIFLIVYLTQVSRHNRSMVVSYFVFGGVLSSIYGLTHYYFMMNGVDIDPNIWGVISNSHASDMERYMSYSMNGIYRGKGFAGSNATATYYVTIIPLLFLFLLIGKGFKKFKYSVYLLLVVSSLLIIMSRVGISATMLSLFLFLFFSGRKKILIYTILIFSFSLYMLALNLNIDTLESIISSRVNTDTDRYLLFEGALNFFLENPFFGSGANNYSQYAIESNNRLLHDENLHSSWMTILFETGIFGFISHILIFLYAIKKTYRVDSIYSKPYIASLLALILAGFGNQLFDLFYFQFFFIIMFSIIISCDSTKPSLYGLKS